MRDQSVPASVVSDANPSIGRLAGAVLATHVTFVAAVIPLLDKFLTLERMLRWLTPRRPSRLYEGTDLVLISRIVHRRLRRPIHMRRRACLRLSLVIYHFARLAGAEAVFHVAVFPPSTDPKRLHAHSWVTVGGACLCEAPKGQSAEIVRYGRTSALPSGHESIAEGFQRQLQNLTDSGWTHRGPRV